MSATVRILAIMAVHGAAWGQAAPPCPEEVEFAGGVPHQSRLCAVLAIVNGQLAVVPQASRLYGSPEIDRGKPLAGARAEAVRDELLGELAAALAAIPLLYEYGFTDTERAEEKAGTLAAAARRPLDTLTSESWEDAIARYEEWAGAKPNRRNLENALLQAIGELKLDSSTGLFLRPGDLDADAGTVLLHVADLAPDTGDRERLAVCFVDAAGACRDNGAVLTRAGLGALLKRTPGHPWRAAVIREQIEGYYRQRGLDAGVRVSAAADPRRIAIGEGRRVARVLWSEEVESDLALADEALSVLLSRADFAAYRNRRAGLVQTVTLAGAAAFRGLWYAGGCEPPCRTLAGSPPFLNERVTGVQQAQLAEMGLILNLQGAPDEPGDASRPDRDLARKTYLLVQAKAPGGEAAKPESAPDAAPERPVDAGRVTPPRAPQPVPAPGEAAVPRAQDEPPPPAVKDQKNYVGAGFAYRPGQRVRFFGLGQRSRTRIGSAFASFTGQSGADGEAFGSGTAAFDYLWFGSLHHRLAAEFSGRSQFTERRILYGILTGERRSGGQARFEYDALGGNEETGLTLSAELGRATVAFASPALAAKVNLTTVAFGGTWRAAKLNAAHPYRVTVAPRILAGLGLSATEPVYVVAGVRTNWNHHLFDSGITTLDVSAAGQWGTGKTPVFEQPSLGGAETLRGFRADDAIGRKLVSLQPELWFDVPGFRKSESKLGQFVRDNLRLAAFVDAGAIYGAAKPWYRNGWRAGPGLGARWIQGFLALKVDWAYGIGEGVLGRGHGRFYVGVSTNSTF